MSLVYPLDIRGRAIAGLHEEGVAELRRAFEHEPAVRQEAVRDDGEAGQHDADEQRSRVAGLFQDGFGGFAHALAILPSRPGQYRERYRDLRTGIYP